MKTKITKLIICFLLLASIQSNFAQNKDFKVTCKRNDDRSLSFNYEKKVPGTYYVIITFKGLENAFYNTKRVVVKSRFGNIFKLKPIDKNKGISFSGFNYRWIRGNPKAKVDSLFTYILPFKKGKKVRVIKARFVGERYFGNEKPINWTSHIAVSKKQDTIYAMRKGIVVKIRNKHNLDTTYTKKFTTKTNTITIEHKDGTYARYGNIKKNSFFVKLGQKVYPQTKLGIMEKSPKNKEYYKVSFSVYYPSLENINLKEKKTLKNRKSYHKYINPFFMTEQGVVKLKHKGKYIVDFDEELLLKEFKRREKKKYKKSLKNK